MMTLIFTCEGQDHEIELIDRPASPTLAQLTAVCSFFGWTPPKRLPRMPGAAPAN